MGRAIGSESPTGGARTLTGLGCARRRRPTPRSTMRRYPRSRRQPSQSRRRSCDGEPALGGVRAAASRPRAHARRQPSRAGRGDRATQRPRRLHATAGGRLDLGRTGRRDHRVQPGREGRVLRPGGRQGLPSSDLLRGAGRRWSPVTESATEQPRSGVVARDDLVAYLLRLGDDALITAQRLGEWSARAPEMEEDIALSNIALDQLGAARLFLTYAGEVEGVGRDEDALAYLRQDNEFR